VASPAQVQKYRRMSIAVDDTLEDQKIGDALHPAPTFDPLVRVPGYRNDRAINIEEIIDINARRIDARKYAAPTSGTV